MFTGQHGARGWRGESRGDKQEKQSEVGEVMGQQRGEMGEQVMKDPVGPSEFFSINIE